jgi:hypothetical protein
LYCTNSEDARLCWEGKQKEKGPSLQMEKVARVIYFSKRGNSYNAFRGVCCPGVKTQACVCPHPERQTLRLYDVGMRHGWSDEAVPGAITNCMQLRITICRIACNRRLGCWLLERKRGSCGRRAMIGIPPAVISIAGKPICRRVERLVSHWCAAELQARLGVKRATGQPGSGVVVPSLVR